MAIRILGPQLRIAAAGALAAGLAACDGAKPPEVPLKPVVVTTPVQAPAPAPAAAGPVAKAEPGNKADADLAARVKSALAAEPGLQSFTMDVTAAGGVVSLFGTAPNLAIRDRAAAAAARVAGVKSVQNNLAIVAGS
ncbi:MAG: BON domain-containing protein [Proteobacteria bacterium]|nr:BON domain-containing protein [Pseudomonadota bacterium]